ncbi:MAG: ATP-binding cassette domain-containing protein [Candidatus Magasanikbacteria bacterium]|jgi:ABC-type nitrate/sulfonate/bicarbonate transport system ATPase subunit/ABC-type nitrate/sulfonate/bicarbonate transport system substrate-binding protein
MIEVHKLTKHYYDRENKSFIAINDISFDIKKGEIVCIVGPSGSGKSTILKCVTGLDTVFEGNIKINGLDSSKYLENNRIALVSQQYSNFPWLNVFENIAIGFYGKNMSETEVRTETNKLLKRVGLYKVKDYFPNKLSGGMQQRIAIARAIAQQTDLIAFDEPFGALDVQTRSQMQEFLARLWEEEQKTMILVTHDIDEAIYLADRIIVLGLNPGTVKQVVKVNIKRPRKPEIRFHEDFIKLKKFISYIIRSESIKASLEEGIVTDTDVFKMGLYIWSGNTPLYYAKDSGLFIDESLDVEQINFEDNKKKVELWEQGKLDAINVTLDKAIELHSKITDLRIVKVLNRSVGGDALVAQSNIKSVIELKGKTIGLEKGSVAEFFLSYILQKEGMTSKDVKIKDMQCSEIGAGIIAGNIEAGIIWEPWLEKALELSNINILKTTNDYPILYDVLIVNNKLLQQKTKEIEKIKKVWNQSVAIWKKQEKEVINIASSHVGIPERELTESLKKIEFFDTIPDDFNSVVDEIIKVLINDKLIKNNYSTENLFIE